MCRLNDYLLFWKTDSLRTRMNQRGVQSEVEHLAQKICDRVGVLKSLES
ncbi:hypothetical protein N9181_00030 [bacterium]|nr:hypothetical protein [bacterium]